MTNSKESDAFSGNDQFGNKIKNKDILRKTIIELETQIGKVIVHLETSI